MVDISDAVYSLNVLFLDGPSIPPPYPACGLDVGSVDLLGCVVRRVRESLGIADNLKLAVLCYFKGECKIETVREHTKEIGLQESRVDKLEWDLTKEIFTSSIDFAHQLHLRLCLESIVEVSDRAEDAGDQLELATLKSMV